MFRDGYDFNKFLIYKDKVAKELKIKDWKKDYIYDCKVIYIDSIELRDTLIKMYPTNFFGIPFSFLNLNQIVSINLTTKKLRYVISDMDNQYKTETNPRPMIITHRKKIYNDIIKMRREHFKNQQK